MKTQSSLPVILSAGCAALFFYLGCSKENGTTVIENTKTDVTVSLSNAWDGIKDFSYERRADFTAGVDRLSNDMDEKTAGIRSVSRDRAGALKEYDDARADLKSKRSALDNSTADTWSDAKAKNAEAWKKTKDAYDKVIRSNGS